MPAEYTAVQCAHCKKFHDKAGAYIIVDRAMIHQKVHDDAHASTKDRAASVNFVDVVVCDDECLCCLLTMGKERRE